MMGDLGVWGEGGSKGLWSDVIQGMGERGIQGCGGGEYAGVCEGGGGSGVQWEGWGSRGVENIIFNSAESGTL